MTLAQHSPGTSRGQCAGVGLPSPCLPPCPPCTLPVLWKGIGNGLPVSSQRNLLAKPPGNHPRNRALPRWPPGHSSHSAHSSPAGASVPVSPTSSLRLRPATLPRTPAPLTRGHGSPPRCVHLRTAARESGRQLRPHRESVLQTNPWKVGRDRQAQPGHTIQQGTTGSLACLLKAFAVLHVSALPPTL